MIWCRFIWFEMQKLTFVLLRESCEMGMLIKQDGDIEPGAFPTWRNHIYWTLSKNIQPCSQALMIDEGLKDGWHKQMGYNGTTSVSNKVAGGCKPGSKGWVWIWMCVGLDNVPFLSLMEGKQVAELDQIQGKGSDAICMGSVRVTRNGSQKWSFV